jgi:DNA-binding response OmpR family regulator
VLVVEDERRMAALLAQGLGEEGWQVEVVGTVAAASARVDDGWDVIVLDWGLPDGDGLTLLGRWRRRGLDTPVLMLTARDRERVAVCAGATLPTKPLRSTAPAGPRRGAPPGCALAIGRLSLDERGRRQRRRGRTRELDVARILAEAAIAARQRRGPLDGSPNASTYIGYLAAGCASSASRRR